MQLICVWACAMVFKWTLTLFCCPGINRRMIQGNENKARVRLFVQYSERRFSFYNFKCFRLCFEENLLFYAHTLYIQHDMFDYRAQVWIFTSLIYIKVEGKLDDDFIFSRHYSNESIKHVKEKTVKHYYHDINSLNQY